PQHLTPPALVTAQVCKPPTAMAETPLASPETSTGVNRERKIAAQGWPEAFQPQHLTPPALVSAQVWEPPVAMAMTPLVSPETSAGVERLVCIPSPSWP